MNTLVPFKDGKYIPVEEALKQLQAYKAPEPRHVQEPSGTAPTITDAEDYLVLEKIVCVGSDGKSFEQYPTIYVAKDIERNKNERFPCTVLFTPYQAITHFEQAGNGMFLPSFALSCNILAKLYAGRSDPEFKKALDQYNDYGPGRGYHVQNTIIDWTNHNIIHYPYDTDLPGLFTLKTVNQNLRKSFAFDPTIGGTIGLENALKDSRFNNFIKNITGLPDPAILIEISKYFHRAPGFYTSSVDKTTSTWLGSDVDDEFDINIGLEINYNGAARGVRRQ
jgi:hypothetical protein